MELKGSRTEQNLLNAFSGESMARNKYLFFAEKAKQENHPEVAELFEKMAQNGGCKGHDNPMIVSSLCPSSGEIRYAFYHKTVFRLRYPASQRIHCRRHCGQPVTLFQAQAFSMVNFGLSLRCTGAYSQGRHHVGNLRHINGKPLQTAKRLFCIWIPGFKNTVFESKLKSKSLK